MKKNEIESHIHLRSWNYITIRISVVPQEDAKMDAQDAFYTDVLNRQLMLNVEHRIGGCECVSLCDPDSKEDVAKGLISGGLLLVEQRKEKRFAKMISEYNKAQDLAKANRVSISSLKTFKSLLFYLPPFSFICLYHYKITCS